MTTLLDYLAGREAPENTSVLEPGGDTRGYIASDSGPVPIEDSPLPAIGGVLGTIGGVALQKAPYIGPALTLGSIGQKSGLLGGAARTLAPTLIGSTAGTSGGLLLEGGLQGEMPSSNRVIGELVTNAAFDVGGNLVFGALGKTYTVAKENIPFLKGSSPEDARIAAQQFLSDRGATLSKAQLSGKPLDVAIEEVVRGGSGAPVFRQQEQGVRDAINQGVAEFKDRLATSEPFRMALKQGDPTQMALGDNFKAAVNIARDEFKAVHRPFYEKLTQDTGALVDMRGIKAQAQAEYDRLAKGGIKSDAGRSKAKILEDVINQNDFVDFGVAHDIRSSFGASARDAVEAGGKQNTVSAGYTKYESGISTAMDDAFKVVGSNKKRVEGQGLPFTKTPAESTEAISTGQSGFNPYLQKTPETEDLVRQYRLTQESYKKGMDGLYNNTLTKALELEPEAVGKYLFNPEYASRFRDVSKAVAQVDKYARQDVVNGLKYGFIEQAMSNPDNVLKLSKTLESDKAFKQGFDYLFKATGEKEFLTNILGAAKYGLDEGALSQLARNRVALEGTRILGQAGALTGGYLLLPEGSQENIKSALPEAVTTAGVLLLTPRFIAKAMTNKQAMNALADIGKVQANPKLAGALTAKIFDNLNESGIIDNEYITEVNNRLKGTQQPAEEQQAQPQGTNNLLDYLNQE
jgi:hypothetical protein